jgi:crossover junction endodeoxyribonuclease RusA
MEIDFPIEFVVEGTPVSFQAARAASKSQWKARVKDASRSALPDGHMASEGKISATLFYFPSSPMHGDIDNIVKPILDALSRHVYMDDAQIERIVIQKFEPGAVFAFGSPSDVLQTALSGRKPLLYVRLSDDPFEELT